MTETAPRRLLFFVDVACGGRVIARGMNNDIELHSDSLPDLRGLLADQLDRLGIDWRIVGIRDQSQGAKA